MEISEMSNTNVVVITGNLVADVDYRVYPQSGDGIAEMSVAVNKHRFNQQTNQFDTFTTWVPVRMLGKLAERAVEKLSKGAKLTITGELAEDSWVDDSTQKQRSKLLVLGGSFEYLGGGTKANQSADRSGTPNQGKNRDQQSQGNQGSRPKPQGQQGQRASQQPVKRTQPVAASSRPAGYN
jgi:single stranded DNA-binding protein